MNQGAQENLKKENYELVLSFIADKLNSNPEFSRYVKAEIYEYSKKNQSNVIHIKNINAKAGEDCAKIAEELRAFM
jgi:Golgi nucleoside diphosphatase